MGWHTHITFNPEILAGKSVIKGTRLSVEFIVGLLAQGWSETDVLRNYPGLNRGDIQACLAHSDGAPSAVPRSSSPGGLQPPTKRG
jgi:uncharacterized protein (DUF433 family)